MLVSDFGRAALSNRSFAPLGVGLPLAANATNSAGDKRHRFEISHDTARPATSALPLPAQPVAATQALNLSAGVSNCKVSRGRSFS